MATIALSLPRRQKRSTTGYTFSSSRSYRVPTNNSSSSSSTPLKQQQQHPLDFRPRTRRRLSSYMHYAGIHHAKSAASGRLRVGGALLLLVLLLQTLSAAGSASASLIQGSAVGRNNCTLSLGHDAGEPPPVVVDSGGNGTIVDTLWSWCTEDAACRAVYHQAPAAPNRTVFRHLLPVGVPAADLYDKAREFLCGVSGDVALANRELWLRFLVANRRTLAPLCDVNHELVFDADTLASTCACRADRVCTDSLYDLVPTYIVLALAVIAIIGFVAVQIYASVVLMRQLRRITGRETDDLSVLLNAL